MPSEWSYPNTATQYAEAPVHVPWLNVDENFDEINLVRGQTDLRHISNSLVNDIKMKTYYLALTEFDWINMPETLTGLEVYVKLRRTGRIFDDTVQLYYQGQPIGANMANHDLLDLKVYGGETFKWGIDDLSIEMLSDPDFGIVLRYQSHPTIPHQTCPYMEHVQLRAW
jgi:hypothetical protein